MADRFKNPTVQKAYAAYLAFYPQGVAGPLFHKSGRPNRASSCRHAFWNGFHGFPARHVRTSLSYAAWAAGRETADRKGHRRLIETTD